MTLLLKKIPSGMSTYYLYYFSRNNRWGADRDLLNIAILGTVSLFLDNEV